MVTHIGRDQVPRGITDNGAAGQNLPFLSEERLYGMRIDRHGQWFHEGRPILRAPLVKLFASVLRREKDGSYWLVTPVERGRIDVEDVPFVVVDLAVERFDSEQIIKVRSNLDEWVTIGSDHPLSLRRPPNAPSTTAPAPYVEFRSGLEGRLLRTVYYELVDLCEPQQQDGIIRYGIWSAGFFHPLDDQLV